MEQVSDDKKKLKAQPKFLFTLQTGLLVLTLKQIQLQCVKINYNKTFLFLIHARGRTAGNKLIGTHFFLLLLQPLNYNNVQCNIMGL